MKRIQLLSHLTPGRKAVVEIVENTYLVGTDHLKDSALKKKVDGLQTFKLVFFILLCISTLIGLFFSLRKEELLGKV
jgi:hypothetical protein